MICVRTKLPCILQDFAQASLKYMRCCGWMRKEKFKKKMLIGPKTEQKKNTSISEDKQRKRGGMVGRSGGIHGHMQNAPLLYHCLLDPNAPRIHLLCNSKNMTK